jgi:uncharacterized protein (DUF4415 family)
MKKSKPLTDKDREVRELNDEDFRRFRPTYDVVPAELAELMKAHRARGQRGPQKAPTKTQLTIRIDTDIVDRFRATGPGWQSRINEALRKARVG